MEQGVQAVALLAEKVPAAQLGQVRGMREAVKVPPGQPWEESKHAVAPGALLKPEAQGRQALTEMAALASLNVFTGHCVGVGAPGGVKEPGGQHVREAGVAY